MTHGTHAHVRGVGGCQHAHARATTRSLSHADTRSAGIARGGVWWRVWSPHGDTPRAHRTWGGGGGGGGAAIAGADVVGVGAGEDFGTPDVEHALAIAVLILAGGTMGALDVVAVLVVAVDSGEVVGTVGRGGDHRYATTTGGRSGSCSCS